MMVSKIQYSFRLDFRKFVVSLSQEAASAIRNTNRIGILLDSSMTSHGLSETGGGLMLPLGKNLYQNIHNT
jgi:hypothetical protein